MNAINYQHMIINHRCIINFHSIKFFQALYEQPNNVITEQKPEEHNSSTSVVQSEVQTRRHGNDKSRQMLPTN